MNVTAYTLEAVSKDSFCGIFLYTENINGKSFHPECTDTDTSRTFRGRAFLKGFEKRLKQKGFGFCGHDDN